MIPQYIPDIFDSVVSRVSSVFESRPVKPFKVFFDFGHYREVLRQLTWKDASITLKEHKYPLVWLVMDFDEFIGESPAFYAKTGLQFLILNSADSVWTMKERRDNNYLPVLYPVLAEFIKQVSSTVELGMIPEQKISFIKTDRPYWGLDEGGNYSANLFNDFIDAIQIRNLKINIINKTC